MPKFGRHSLEVRDTLHPDLQLIVDEVIEVFDIRLIEGHRGQERQDALFNADPPRTKVKFPNSKHNPLPSIAVDVMPYHPTPPHIDWNHSPSIHLLAGFMLATARQLFEAGKISHLLRWGGDWDRDYNIKEPRRFIDSPHYELFEPT